MRPLDFITVRDTTGRASSFAIGEHLEVVGVLPHCAKIAPDTQADADKWIAWLQEWKQQHTTPNPQPQTNHDTSNRRLH